MKETSRRDKDYISDISIEADSLGNVATVDSDDGSELDGSEFDVIPLMVIANIIL